jgi:hypothetical protein
MEEHNSHETRLGMAVTVAVGFMGGGGGKGIGYIWEYSQEFVNLYPKTPKLA